MPRRNGTKCPRCQRRRPKGERCLVCARRLRAATTTQRGYGSEHQQLRAIVAVEVAEGRARCWRCSKIIAKDAKWQLGHDDSDRTKYRGPEHRRCNEEAAARRRHAA